MGKQRRPIARVVDGLARDKAGKPTDLAISQAKLAEVLRLLGRNEEAEALYALAIPTMETHLSKSHPTTLTGYNNRASNLNALGRFGEAEGLLHQVIAARREQDGEYHPEMAAGL